MSRFLWYIALFAFVLCGTAAVLNAMLIVSDGPNAMRVGLVLVNAGFALGNGYLTFKRWPRGTPDV